ncbi:MAG TPA: ABC transporter permease [Acidimicrobiales bacterium]|nr:ABC transporter permease [Acidimicrobiales bacterium]
MPSIEATLTFLLLGLGAGAVYAALGLGLVLVHRASGVVHVAHGAVGAYVTYVFVELRATGNLVLPVGTVHLGDSVPFTVALPVSLAVAALVGLVMHLLVFRPLRDAPALAGLVASVGLLATLQALIVLRFQAGGRPVPVVLPAEPARLLGVVVPRDRLLLAALVVVVAAVLWAVYRFTRFGLASRALSDDPVGVALLGWSPDRLAAVNWVTASVLAGLAGILVAPVTGLDPVTTTLLVVPALAAALVGRLVSFGATVAAALAVGMAQSEILLLQDQHAWIPRSGIREAVPLVVIVVALALGAGSTLGRAAAGGGSGRRRLPRAGRPRHVGVWTVIGSVVAGAGVIALHGQDRVALDTSLVGALVCLSLVVLTGWSGQISLAQMAFAGVAGFSLSRLTVEAGIPFPVAPLLAAALAAVAGLIVGLPALRARGVSLAVVTLAGGVVVEEVVFKSPLLTGGFGGSRVPSPSLFGVHLDASGRGFGVLVVGVLVVVAVGLARLRAGRVGRRLLAVRANERAAAAAGIDVNATRLWAFALSALLAGTAGALLGYQQGQLSFGSFGAFVSLAYLAVVYVGGIAGIAGALVGGLLVPNGLAFTLVHLGRYQLLASGL